VKNPTDTPLATALAPVLCPNTKLQQRLDDVSADELEACWRQLTERGFEVVIRADDVLVRQRERGFEITVHLSRPDDLGELRLLFLALRRHFGRRRDRWLPWLFLPDPAVTIPYERLRLLIGTCQRLRRQRGEP